MSDFDRFVEEARMVPLADVAGMMGLSLKKASGELVGPCPQCGGDDRFAISIRKNQFNCRGCGIKGGNAIDLVTAGQGLEFVPACEFILNAPAPKSSGGKPAEYRERDPSLDDAEKERAIKKKDDEIAAKEKQVSKFERALEKMFPIFGTKAESYYNARSITITPEQAIDLRFSPSMPYYHEFEDERVVVGEWPCIVAIVRERDDTIVGFHLTYLDRDENMKARVVFERPDGRKDILPPKKMRVGKGLIRLGPVRPIMAIAEGIETTLAWGLLERSSADFCLACAGDLYNFSGRSTANIPHPRLERGSILNGDPDMSSSFMAIPPGVEEVILLGDGDWNHEKVKSHIITAGRRLKAMGLRPSVDLCPMPPEHLKNEVKKGWDWNDILIMRERGEAV